MRAPGSPRWWRAAPTATILSRGMSAFQLAEDRQIPRPGIRWVRPVGNSPRRWRSIDQAPGQAPRAEATSGNRTADGTLLRARSWARRQAMACLHPRCSATRRSQPKILAELKDSAAADYLLETSTQPDELVTRLFHQALADELVARRHRPEDEGRLLQVLQDEGGERSWLASSLYARNHAPSHAAEAELLYGSSDRADFLVSMMPAAMRSALATLTPGSRQGPGIDL